MNEDLRYKKFLEDVEKADTPNLDEAQAWLDKTAEDGGQVFFTTDYRLDCRGEDPVELAEKLSAELLDMNRNIAAGNFTKIHDLNSI